MIKLSFIVPVYNVAPYLRKCVDSLLAQDLPASDYEIILVDDGSPDACPQICDEYAATYENIRVIHRNNGGLSVARNSGIEAARGEYLCFVDSDDYWEENVLGGLMEQVEREKLDVLRFDYQNIRLNTEGSYGVFEPYKRSHRIDNDYSEEVTDGVTFLNSRMSTACYAVMFVLRREILYNDGMSRDKSQNGPLSLNDACLFTEGIYFEDTDWTPRMLVKAKRVASTSTIVYNYLQREGSITKAINRSKQQKVLDDKMRLIGEMQRQSMELQEKGLNNTWFSRMIADAVISVIGILSVDFYNERKAYLKQLNQMNIYSIQSKTLKGRLIKFSPRLAVELLHLKNR